MENIRELKKTNKALLVSNIILGCLLIITMTLLTLVAINTSPINAKAASENLLLQPYKFAEVWNQENNNMILGDRLGLVTGNTYKVTGYYGGESLDSADGATRFNGNVVASDMSDMTGLTSVGMKYNIPLDSEKDLYILIIDGITFTGGAPAIDTTKSVIIVGYEGSYDEEDYALGKNFVLESITEVEASNEEGYVKGELVYENVELTPMTTSSSDTTKIYLFSTGYTSYETNKGYILTLQIDGQDVEIPVYTHTSKENHIIGSYDLVANYDLAGYIDFLGNGRVIVTANGENRTFIVKSIHRYEKWDANVDYGVETSTGKAYKVEKNLAQNIILTKTKTENGLIYYESNVMLENITDYNSLSKLPPLTKIELNNGYKMMDRLSWEVNMEEETYWTSPALYYNYSVAGMQVYYSENKFTAILEGTEGPDTLEITSIDIVKEKVANEMSADGIIGNITGAFTGFLTGTGGGIINFFDTIFLNEEGKLTILAIVGLSMMGLGIATGIIKYLLARVG